MLNWTHFRKSLICIKGFSSENLKGISGPKPVALLHIRFSYVERLPCTTELSGKTWFNLTIYQVLVTAAVVVHVVVEKAEEQTAAWVGLLGREENSGMFSSVFCCCCYLSLGGYMLNIIINSTSISIKDYISIKACSVSVLHLNVKG